MRKFLVLAVAVLATASCNQGFSGIATGGLFVVAVGNEQFRVRIDNTFLATQARRIAGGIEGQKIVNGELQRGNGGFNTGYNWSIKPTTVQFSDVAITGCDAKPSDVEKDIAHWVDEVKRYCPTAGRIIREEANF
ncbi:MAG TPA: hypothetical protein VM100_08240 [Longimicrobiales bacterium]|nr:hypothetical protein [Longimicrobiales bacterium]